MSRRKDRERYLRLKQQNPEYAGFRGIADSAAPRVAAQMLESVVCSVCHRKRNVAASELPEDRASFVCFNCQQSQQDSSVTVVPSTERGA